MKRSLKIALLITSACAVLLFIGSGFIPSWLETRRALRANQLPDAAFRAITSDPSLVLLSLDPTPIPLDLRQHEPGFHGYRVLGQTTVADAGLRGQLAGVLRKGLDTWRFTVPSCFMPRHGLRAILDGQTYEFVICFDCGEAWYYPPDGSQTGFHGFGLNTMPGPFADILSAANVPTAKFP